MTGRIALLQWGIQDSTDGLWIGSKDGPFLFPEQALAKTAAMAVDIRLKQPLGRTRAKIWTGNNVRVGFDERLYD